MSAPGKHEVVVDPETMCPEHGTWFGYCQICHEQHLVPVEVATDATLMKLSDAKPGDVLVIRAENYRDARQLSDALSRVRLPPGSLPPGGVSIVICRPGVEWTLEHKESK